MQIEADNISRLLGENKTVRVNRLRNFQDFM